MRDGAPCFFGCQEGRERKWVPSGGGVEMGRLAAPPDGTHFLSLTTGRGGKQGRRLRGKGVEGREGGDAAPGKRVHSFYGSDHKMNTDCPIFEHKLSV